MLDTSSVCPHALQSKVRPQRQVLLRLKVSPCLNFQASGLPSSGRDFGKVSRPHRERWPDLSARVQKGMRVLGEVLPSETSVGARRKELGEQEHGRAGPGRRKTGLPEREGGYLVTAFLDDE